MDRSRCDPRASGVVLALLLAACGTAPDPATTRREAGPPAQQPSGERSPEGALQLRIADGLVTLHADRVALSTILLELERQGGLRLVSRDALRERVSLDVERQPLPAALRQLMPTHDFLLLQAPAHSMVFIHAAASPTLPVTPPAAAVHDEVGSRLEAIAALPRAAGSAAIRDLGASATLSEAPEIREEALAALGDIGGAEAQAAVATALSDPDSQVRSAAVRAGAARSGAPPSS